MDNRQQKQHVQEPQMIATEIAVSPDAFALKIKDTTMAPRFIEGMLLNVDPSQRVEDRDFAIIHLQDQKHAIFKQILHDGSDIYLKPLNPDFKTTLMDKINGRLIGPVIQARNDFRK